MSTRIRVPRCCDEQDLQVSTLEMVSTVWEVVGVVERDGKIRVLVKPELYEEDRGVPDEIGLSCQGCGVEFDEPGIDDYEIQSEVD